MIYNQEPGQPAEGSAIAETLPTTPPHGEIATSGLRIPPGYISKPSVPGERMDAYWGALFDIPNTRYRVAVCSEGRQWILQYYRGRGQWQGRKYFSNKWRLAKVIEELFGTDAYTRVKDRISELPL